MKVRGRILEVGGCEQRQMSREMERGANVRDPSKLSVYENATMKTDTCMVIKESPDKRINVILSLVSCVPS